LNLTEQIVIFHAASQDIELLQLCFKGLKINNLVDTQIAAFFMGMDDHLGLAKLLENTLDIKISKTETVSNWLKRPLTDKQCDYAVEDVIHLHALYEHMVDRLKENQKYEFFLDECKNLNQLKDPHEAILHKLIKNSDSPKVQAVLKDLILWREMMARRVDIPRTWILTNNHLRFIAIHNDVKEWEKHKVLTSKQITRYSEAILKIHDEHKNLSTTRIYISSEYKNNFDKIAASLRARISDICSSKELPTQFLCSQKRISSIAEIYLNEGKIVELEGWRGKLLNKKIKQVIAKFST
jgi:ribonuclease D